MEHSFAAVTPLDFISYSNLCLFIVPAPFVSYVTTQMYHIDFHMSMAICLQNANVSCIIGTEIILSLCRICPGEMPERTT